MINTLPNKKLNIKLLDNTEIKIKFNMLIYVILSNEFNITEVIKGLDKQVFSSVTKIIYANIKAKNNNIKYEDVVNNVNYDINDFINIIKLVSDFFPLIEKNKEDKKDNTDTENKEDESINVDWLYFVCKSLFYMSDKEFWNSSLRKIDTLIKNYMEFNNPNKKEDGKVYDIDDIL